METIILDEQTRKDLRAELEGLRYHLYELNQDINDSEEGNFWADQSQEITALDVWSRDSSRADEIAVQLERRVFLPCGSFARSGVRKRANGMKKANLALKSNVMPALRS